MTTRNAKNCQADACNCKGSEVKDVREVAHGRLKGLLTRRRCCMVCQVRWTTVEITRDEYNRLVVAAAAKKTKEAKR